VVPFGYTYVGRG